MDYTAAGFKKYGLFKKELGKYGRLRSFQKRVNFYTSLAAKELNGAPLSEAEYEELRIGGPLFPRRAPSGVEPSWKRKKSGPASSRISTPTP